MPIGYIIQENDADYSALHHKLLEEWRSPNPNTDEPVIIETADKLRPQQAPTHLYVIWNEWGHLSQRRRSEMMMEVYEQVRGRAAALNVTFAMGLTAEEAKNLGIRYTAESPAKAV